MKRFFLISLLLFPFVLNAKKTDDYLNESEVGVCKEVMSEDGGMAIYHCASLMAEDSEKKLNKRLSERKVELIKINNREIIKAFEKDQRSWEKYKKDRCAYVTSGTEKDSVAYQFNLDLCNASENYRRIETLEDEPSFP